jgi:L-alanine-DL-glutamate epimerase-like enolase superfamily enzyme
MAAADLIRSRVASIVTGRRAMDVEAGYVAMMQAVRNLGRQGIAAAAVSAVDNALSDLKARLLNVPLVSLIGVEGHSSAVFPDTKPLLIPPLTTLGAVIRPRGPVQPHLPG